MTAGEWFVGTCIFMLLGIQIGVWVAGAKKHRRQRRDEQVRQAYWDGHRAAEQHDEQHRQVMSLADRILDLEMHLEMLEGADQIEHPRWAEGWEAFIDQIRPQSRETRESPVAQAFVEGQNGERIVHTSRDTGRGFTVNCTTKFKKRPGPPEPPPPTSGAVTKRARRRT